MARLVVITGPIAAGKSTVAALLAARLVAAGESTAVVEVDDVAGMVTGGAAGGGLWGAAHEAHAALVAGWLTTAVRVVIAVGPVFSPEEWRVFEAAVPPTGLRVVALVEAPVPTTLARAVGDGARGVSRNPAFHAAARERFRSLRAGIPADLRFDSGDLTAETIAAALAEAVLSGSSADASPGG